MANRYSKQFTAGNFPGVSHVFASISFGTSGAPTLGGSAGYISSVARNNPGDYTITLADSWFALLGLGHIFKFASAAPSAPLAYIKAEGVASTKTINVIFTDAAGTATDPASGEVVYLDLRLKNSSVTF